MPPFFFNERPPPEFSPLPLPAALPPPPPRRRPPPRPWPRGRRSRRPGRPPRPCRSEEHTSELQSQSNLVCPLFFLMSGRPPSSPLFPYPPLSRPPPPAADRRRGPGPGGGVREDREGRRGPADRKSTRLNSSHSQISYAPFFF